jgi:hypothetical protein
VLIFEYDVSVQQQNQHKNDSSSAIQLSVHCLHHVVIQSHTSIPIYLGHFLYHDNSMFGCVPVPYSFLGHGKLTQFGGSESLALGDIHRLAA